MDKMVDKVKNSSNTTKIVCSTIASIVIAWVGAWQTVQASNGKQTSLTPQEQTQVRLLISTESPVNNRDRAVLYQSLRDINNKLTSIQITVAGDHVLIKNIATRR